MNVLMTILMAAQILAAVAMIGLILMQHGKGADAGAAFGGGGSASLFGASGSANFLSRSTAVLATIFLACTLALAYFSNARPVAASGGSSVLESVPEVPVAPTEVPGAAGGNVSPAPAAPGAPQIPTQ